MTTPDLICEIDFPGNGTWTDVTSFVEGGAFNIQHGRPNEQTSCSPGTMAFTLDNRDGRFTAGLASSPYYPNVRVGRPCRLRASYVPGKNFLQNPGFEDPRTIQNYLEVPQRAGSRFGYWTFQLSNPLFAIWLAQTGGGITGNCLQAENRSGSATNGVVAQEFGGLTVGQTYTAQVYVWQTAGSTTLGIEGIGSSAAVTTFSAWTQIVYTFTATKRYHRLIVTKPSMGILEDFYLDNAQVELGGAATAVDLTSGAMHSGRFYGHLGGWPVSWEGNSADLSYVAVTATDILGKLSRKTLGTQMFEEIQFCYDHPEAYFPLDTPQGSIVAANFGSSQDVPPLTIEKLGTGGPGTLDFGSEMVLKYFTTNGAIKAPGAGFTNNHTDVNNMQYLVSRTLTPIDGTGKGFMMSAWIAPTAINPTNEMVIMAAHATNGDWMRAVLTSSSFVTVTRYKYDGTVIWSMNHQVPPDSVPPVLPLDPTKNGVFITFGEEWNGSSYDAWFRANGVDMIGCHIVNATSTPFIAWELFVGGHYGALANPVGYTGVVSHAVFSSKPPTQRLSATFNDTSIMNRVSGYSSTTAGFVIASIFNYYTNQWSANLKPQVMVGYSQGESPMFGELPDLSGNSMLTAMQTLERAEQGVLFADGDGFLVFQNRAFRWNVTGATYSTLAAGTYEAVSPVLDDVYLLNSQKVTSSLNGDAVATNKASYDAYGAYAASDINALFYWPTEDNANLDPGPDSVAKAVVNLYGEPAPRINSVKVEMLTQPSLFTVLLPLQISDPIYLAGMPSQAPSANADCFIEGWQETIAVDTWEITFNTSPVSLATMFKFDDAGSSMDGVGQHISY